MASNKELGLTKRLEIEPINGQAALHGHFADFTAMGEYVRKSIPYSPFFIIPSRSLVAGYEDCGVDVVLLALP